MQKIIIVLDGLSIDAIQPFVDEIVQNGSIALPVHISRDFFSTHFDPSFERHLSDYNAIFRRNGISDYEAVLRGDHPSSKSVYQVLADEIRDNHPNIDFGSIDRVIYNKEDSSWAELEFCLVFFGHSQWDEYVVGV